MYFFMMSSCVLDHVRCRRDVSTSWRTSNAIAGWSTLMSSVCHEGWVGTEGKIINRIIIRMEYIFQRGGGSCAAELIFILISRSVLTRLNVYNVCESGPLNVAALQMVVQITLCGRFFKNVYEIHHVPRHINPLSIPSTWWYWDKSLAAAYTKKKALVTYML